MSLELIVRTYKVNIQPKAQYELTRFAELETAIAVEKAALAINHKEKRFSHQRRLKKANLEEAKTKLLANLNELKASTNFDDLFLLVKKLVRPIKGIGELYVYDTALRIGANLGLLPTKVYLHAGTRTGAKRLGFQGKEPTIAVSRFPKALQKLQPHEIEDVLCIFKDELGQVEFQTFDKKKAKRSWCS